MNWRDRTRRPRNLLCRWFGHKWQFERLRWAYGCMGDPRYWHRVCLRCGLTATHEPCPFLDWRLYEAERELARMMLGGKALEDYEADQERNIEERRKIYGLE